MPRSRDFSAATVRLIKAALKVVRRQYGSITPAHIVDFARSTKSPLHRFFEWDNTKAAERYRLDQARGMVQRVRLRMVVQGRRTAVPVRVYTSVTKRGVRQYAPTEEVIADRVTAEQVLEEMREDLQQMIARFKTYEFLATRKGVQALRAALRELDGIEVPAEKRRKAA